MTSQNDASAVRYPRRLSLDGAAAPQTVFLWGPRQTGKSTLLATRFPAGKSYDLLLSSEYRRLTANPGIIREECLAAGLTGQTQTAPIVIDEVQKVPELLDEVHWLIERRGLSFILSGSSPRKLRRHSGNLLGGRALRRFLFPLVYPEVPDFDLDAAINVGLLPRHYCQPAAARELLRAYVGDYLQTEIAAEAVVRSIPAFARFLEMAALSNGEMVNFVNIARECGVSAPTVKNHFHVLEDTLIGWFLPAHTERVKRRVIQTPKFWFFDVGVVAELTHRGTVAPGSELFGRAFEHFITMEVRAHSHYCGIEYPLAYWRTASQIEVDLVLNAGEMIVEIKTAATANDRHLAGLRAFREERPVRNAVLVSLDPTPRRTEDGIDILPWRVFLDRLWGGDLVRG